MSSSFTESIVDDVALAWLEALGYAVLHGPDIAAGEPVAELSDALTPTLLALEGCLRVSSSDCKPVATQTYNNGAI